MFAARRVLVLGAGSGASNNLIRSLKAGDPALVAIGCHDDRFVIRKSVADRSYPLPAAQPAYERKLCEIIRSERIDLVIPNSEVDALMMSELRDRIPCRTFLPASSTIERCQDKYELARFLQRAGLPVPVTCAVDSVDDIEELFERFAGRSKLWCRVRKGSGSAAALPVRSADQARGWIEYWEDMRGVPPGSFILSEYLPGRDLTVQCLFKNGTLLMTKMHERLTYHVVGSAASGVSSTAALAKMVFEPPLLELSVNAILAVDAEASGVFFVDFKENAAGEACITEINAGRFANVPVIHDLAGEDNMAVTYVRAALDEPVAVHEARTYAEDCYVLRGIDSLPAVVRGSELFGSDEWRG